MAHRVPKDLSRYGVPQIVLKHPAYASPPAFELNLRPLDQLRAGTAVMVMHKGVVIEGVVTDPQGKPVAAAAVGQFGDLSGSDFPRATTDQKGRYRLPACEAGEYTIAAVAKGYAPDSIRIAVGKGPPTVDLQLRKGEMIRIRVVDKQGRPLRGATVSTVFDNENWRAMMLDYQVAYERDKGQQSLLPDAEGRWSKLWIPGDAIHFQITKPGYEVADKKVAPRGPEYVIVLEAGGWRLSGSVVDRDTNSPITRFYLVEGENHGLMLWRQRTAVENAKGAYVKQWDNSGDSHRVVRIEADGHLPSKPLTLNPSERAATFNVELQKGKEIAGVVRGPNGKPVAGADVALASATRLLYLRNSRPASDQNPLLARTDADGRFAIAPQDEPYILVAMHDLGFGRIDGDANRNEITLQPWARIEGTVYVDGRPAAKEQVRINFDDDGMNIALLPWGQTNPGRYLYYDYQTQTDDNGHFALDRVRPGSAKISRFVKVSQKGMMSGWQDADTRAIDIIPGQTLTVDLGTPNDGSKPRADAANAKVSGKVTDESGRAVDGAEVWLRLREHVQYAKADSQGQFSLEVPSAWLAQLPLTLWAYAAGHQLGRGNVELSGSASNLTIRLAPATDTSFVVSDPEGRPCAGALVEPYYIRNGRGNNEPLPDELLARVGARTDTEGRVKLPAAPPDLLYQIRVHAKGFGTQLQPATPASAIVGSAIRLRPVGKIEGHVVGGPPQLVRSVELVFTSGEYDKPRPFPLKEWPIEGYAEVKPDEQGRFTVPAIAVGDAWIQAYYLDEKQPLRLKLPESVAVQAGRTTSLEIPLVPSVIVRGSVRVKDTGKPVSGAQIHIRYGVGRQGAMAVSDAQGNYTARVLPGRIGLQVIFMPEPYALLSEGAARVTDDRSFEVPKDAKEFDLPPIEAGLAGPTKSIPGRVVDQQGQPVGNIHISAVEGDRRYGYGKSDKEGRFEVAGVPVTINPGKVKYGWLPEVGPGKPFVSPKLSKCEVLKTDPLLLRALPRDPLWDMP